MKFVGQSFVIIVQKLLPLLGNRFKEGHIICAYIMIETLILI